MTNSYNLGIFYIKYQINLIGLLISTLSLNIE